MCVNYRDLNKGSPEDDFLLLDIAVIVDKTAGHTLFSFMYGFFDCKQIQMALEDREDLIHHLLEHFML